MGSSSGVPRACSENQVSSKRWPVRSWSFSCRAPGVEELQCSVERLRILPLGRDSGIFPSWAKEVEDFCRELGLSFFALARLVKDAECVNVRDSLRNARLVGVSRLYGASSSVIVFDRSLLATVAISRFRSEIPRKCLRRRF
jgi:hypothetical protein